MIARAKQLIGHPAVSKTIIVTVGSFTGSVFAYLLQIFLGRWLSVENFGVFTALLSLYVVIGVLATAASTALIRLVSKLAASNKFDVLTHLFIELSLGVLGLGVILFLLIVLLKVELGNFLSISNFSLFLYFGGFVGISFLNVLPTAYLQGLLRFKAYSFFITASQLLRLLFSVVAVILGFGLPGVFVGLGLSIVVSFLLGTLILKRNFISFKKSSLRPHFKGFITFAWSVLFVQVGMTLLNNIDVILVKHFFSSFTSGIYAGLLTIGKVLLFGAGTVSVVMYPMISSAYDKGEDYMEKFKILLFLQVFVVVVGVVIFTIFPNIITRVMFGEAYLASAEFLPRFVLFVGVYVMTNFMILFLLAINKVRVFLFLIPAIIAQIVLISLFHDSIVSIVNVNLAVSASLLLGVVLYSIKNVGIRNNSGVQAGRHN